MRPIWALTPTTDIPLGFKAPDFELIDTISDNIIKLNDIKGEKGTVVMFICNHCPYVIHVREELVRLANDYLPEGIGFVAISSNDIVNYPDDAPHLMKELGRSLNFPFPYLYDDSQEIAKAYDAACTPDLSVFDAELICVYRGQLDESRPGNNVPVNGDTLRKALNELLEKGTINPHNQKPSVGCGIKWKK